MVRYILRFEYSVAEDLQFKIHCFSNHLCSLLPVVSLSVSHFVLAVRFSYFFFLLLYQLSIQFQDNHYLHCSVHDTQGHCALCYTRSLCTVLHKVIVHMRMCTRTVRVCQMAQTVQMHTTVNEQLNT